jgi:hypothetical protein
MELVAQTVKGLVPIVDYSKSLHTLGQVWLQNWIVQFRKETGKQQWTGNEEKMLKFASLVERSLDLFHSSQTSLDDRSPMWIATLLEMIEPLLDELIQNLKQKIDKSGQQLTNLAPLTKPLGYLCEQLNRISTSAVRRCEMNRRDRSRTV